MRYCSFGKKISIIFIFLAVLLLAFNLTLTQCYFILIGCIYCRFPYFTNKGIEKGVQFISKRLNDEDGLGGIFPAMANVLMAFDALGINKNDPRVWPQNFAIFS